MKTPFYTQIESIANHKARFHVPGHKGNPQAIPGFGPALHLDLTEVEGACDLSNPDGPLAASQNNMALAYGSGATLYSASGSTSCIQAMLALFAPIDSPIVMARNCHVSAVRAIAFLNLAPTWVFPKNGPPTAAQIQAALQESQAKTVYITSPDYYGQMADIPAIAEVCRQHQASLLVDNAHGAHLRFLSPSRHPLSLGADATADSAHKTLPCLTPAAMLHLKEKALAAKARQCLNLFSSTSPSYLVLESLDLAAGRLLAGEIDFCSTARRMQQLAQKHAHLVQHSDDPLKLCLRPAKAGWTAHALLEKMNQAGVVPELADSHSIVLMASPFNTESDFTALDEVLSHFKQNTPIFTEHYMFLKHNYYTSIRQALFSETEAVPCEQAAGRVCASLAVPCPPGMPLVLPGEEISRQAALQYLSGGILTIDVLK